MQLLIGLVLGLLVIAGTTLLGPRLGVFAPLLLVVVGVVVSFVPYLPSLPVDPELILIGVLPPLLYSASISMPAMNFRREFGAISGLSVVLIIGSAVVLGIFFAWVIPGLGLWWGIALGAIVSPTDAVATSIVKRTSASPRVISILEGESLLNDATALVLLRTAIVGAAVSISFWAVIGSFVLEVLVAIIIGVVVGRLNLWVRARVKDATVNTVISFTVPFIASVPAEYLGASGLVAAVVAGLVTGRLAPRLLSPQHRLSDAQNWRTVELLLEGTVFITMGLGLSSTIAKVEDDHAGIWVALAIAAGAFVLTVLVRAAYVTPLLISLQNVSRRGEKMKSQMTKMQQQLDDPNVESPDLGRHGPKRAMTAGDLRRYATRIRRSLADIDYFLEAPLGWRDGTVVIWAGMRGAVTVAAAQTLPSNTPNRALLVLIAFAVAALSLVLQGGTLGSLMRWIKPSTTDPEHVRAERARLLSVLDSVALTSEQGELSGKQRTIAIIEAKRTALLDERDNGTFDAGALESALAALDAEQISIELQGNPYD